MRERSRNCREADMRGKIYRIEGLQRLSVRNILYVNIGRFESCRKSNKDMVTLITCISDNKGGFNRYYVICERC